MSVETRAELPIGLTWKELRSIKAKIPMPEGWFYREDNFPTTKAFAISRERVILGVSEFKTGLSLNVILNFRLAQGMNPSEFAKRFIERPPFVIPTGETVVLHDGPLVSYRRYFKANAKAIRPQQNEPVIFYYEITGNDRTGAAYVMYFETLEAKWEQDCETAKLMIENRVFDKSI